MTDQPDLELDRWKQQWQALGGREDLARSLAERVRHDEGRIRRELALEMAAAAGSVALCLWLLVHHQGKPVVAVICAVSLVFTGVWVTRLLTLKLSGSRAETSGLDAFVELTRRRIADDIQWHTFRRRSLFVVVPLALPLAIWAAVVRYDHYRAEPWLAVAEGGLFLALVIGAVVQIHRKLRSLEAARARFDALVDDRTLR
jgi:hypothetical protein